MKEIGGFFELELDGKEHYHKELIKLNSGRSALAYILKAQKIKKIYIPYYICNSVVEIISRLNIDAQFYKLNEHFEMTEELTIETNERLLYVNYFSIKKKYVNALAIKYKSRLIIDNTQAFFDLPTNSIDTIYSPRKFFGVNDGGYLSTTVLLEEPLKQKESYANFIHLVGRHEKTAAEFYEKYQEAEVSLSETGIFKMSTITEKILKSIDYNKIKLKRQRNFYYIHSLLKNINELSLETLDSIPFVYPLLIKNEKIKTALLQKKIYVATYWVEVLHRKGIGVTEESFVRNIIPVPIDQRYGLAEMKFIANTILDVL